MLKSLLGRGWNKVAGRKACNFNKKRLKHRCFLLNIVTFLTTPVLKNICVRLLLKIKKKTFLGKATGHNDHYMINMGGQRPKIDGNWSLTGPYLHLYCVLISYFFCSLTSISKKWNIEAMLRHISLFMQLAKVSNHKMNKKRSHAYQSMDSEYVTGQINSHILELLLRRFRCLIFAPSQKS